MCFMTYEKNTIFWCESNKYKEMGGIEGCYI